MLSTFKSRLIGILLIINLCMLVVGSLSYYFLGELGGRMEEFTHGISHRLEIANRMQEAADRRAIAVRNMALLSDHTQNANALAAFDKFQAATAQALAELEEAATRSDAPSEVITSIRKVAQIEARYRPIAQAIVEQIKGGQTEEAIRQIRDVCTPTLEALTEAIHDYMGLTDKRTREFVDETATATLWQRAAMAIAALGALGTTCLLGFLLLRNVHKTLGADPETLNIHLGQLAAGNLAEQDHQGQVPPGSLLQSMAKTRRQVRDVVEKVRIASDAIATGSSEIANGNADLSQRTEHQANNLQNTASAMDEMNRAVRQNAETAGTATNLATAVSASAAEGSDVMQRVTVTMADITRSSAQIGDIIGVIDGIAFQTNILALNAAVEAARAGEQGRGFAVVAGEVRTLAHRSAEAAREIKSLISTSLASVEAGSSLVTEAGQKVGSIAHQVQQVVDLMREIGQSAQEQATGIADVSESVTELDQSTQQNAALAEQSAAAAESLKTQSEQLAAAVNYFRL